MADEHDPAGTRAAPLGNDDRGERGLAVPSVSAGERDLAGVAECNKAREAGSNSLAGPVMQAHDGLRRAPGPAPILRVL